MNVLIHYNEIGLKGKNRGFFERKLIENIKESLSREGISVKMVGKKDKRIIVDVDKKEGVEKALNRVFGIASFSFIDVVESKTEAIVERACEIMDSLKIKKLGLKTKRSYKEFPLTSLEINTLIGEEANKSGIKISFNDSDETIFIEITSKNTYFYTRKNNGLGGLPVGASGKVLVLFSGGIDSAVAAYLLMKRGCVIDLLHFHALKSNEDVMKTKIPKLLGKLREYNPRIRLFLVPYQQYSLSSLGNIPDRTDLVMFRHFMFKFGEELAKKYHYKALANGDNIGQVASQTLDNIHASRKEINLQVLSPLLTYDKDEIISLAKKIGTYEESIKEYKDCCSIVSRKPLTKVKSTDVDKYLKNFDINKIINKSAEEMDIVSV